MTSIIDTHCHLDFSAFDHDRDAVLAQCVANKVSNIIVPAVSQSSWHSTIELCAAPNDINNIDNNNKNWPTLHLALGLHPIFIDQHQPQHLSELDGLIKAHKPVAVGEIGLDYYQQRTNQTNDREKQTAFFSKQLIIAKQHGLPVIIHNRKAHDDCVKLLQDIEVIGGIIHNFNGSIQHAYKYIEMGFKLGFGGMLTFERSRVIRALAEKIPLESIVLETDAPDLTVQAHKGKRNSPEYLPFVLQSLADVKGISADQAAIVTSNNAKQVLGI